MPRRQQVKPCDQISGGQEEVLRGRAGMLFVRLRGLIIIVCALNVRGSTLINTGLLHLNCSSNHIALAYQKMINGSCRLMYKNDGIQSKRSWSFCVPCWWGLFPKALSIIRDIFVPSCICTFIFYYLNSHSSELKKISLLAFCTYWNFAK